MSVEEPAFSFAKILENTTLMLYFLVFYSVVLEENQKASYPFDFLLVYEFHVIFQTTCVDDSIGRWR